MIEKILNTPKAYRIGSIMLRFFAHRFCIKLFVLGA